METTARQVLIDTQAQTFTVVWADGHQSVFPLDGLRQACPCAACQGHGAMHRLPAPELFRQPPRRRWENLRAEPAGSIGLRLTWDDGHNTGLYSWERLRAMCPCAACSSG